VKKSMKEGKVHIIYNPVAGGGRASKIKGILLKSLQKRFGTNFQFMETTGVNDATELALKAAFDGPGLIIAVGGDGTINEVINGLLSEKKPVNDDCELGIINCGSGRGLAQTLGLPEVINDQLDLICDTAGKPLDAGFVIYKNGDGGMHERFFISECQIGIGGSVVSQVGRKLKKLGGKFAFGSVAMAHLLNYHASRMTLRIDQQPAESGSMIGITVGNGVYSAGGMMLTPDARVGDGMLDLLAIHEMDRMKRFCQFGKVYSGNHVHNGHFSTYKFRNLIIDSNPPVWIESDGELLGRTPCQIGVVPGAIKVRY
jgi:diacylglycerol kinase (ATP)